jgi:hypothetical protein
MKAISLLITLIFASIVSMAATITATANGAFTVAATWDLNRAPADGDVVVIPFGRTVSLNNTPYPQNNPPARPTFRIEIYGILDFSGPGNDKLYLDAGSVIQIYTNGKIQTSTSSTEIIAIYTGSSDNTVWTGTPNSVNGPAYANAATSGFSSGILPLKLLSFEIGKSGDGKATLTWATTMEINTSYFEVETLAQNQWSTVAKVTATGNSISTTTYSYVASLKEGVNDYRLKMVDIDGRFTYSPVVRLVNNGAIKSASLFYNPASRQIICNGSNISEGFVTVFDFNGRKVLSAKAAERISFSPRAAGVYIVLLKIGTTTLSRKIAVLSL